MENDRRRGGNWAKHNFFAVIGLALIIAGYIWWAAGWSRHIDDALSHTVTKEEFVRMEGKLNNYADKVDKLDCKIYDGCFGQAIPNPNYDSRTGVVNHP